MNSKFVSHTTGFTALTLPLVTHAHDGHSNTPVHALLHMFEANGVWIGLLLVAGIGALAYRALKAGIWQSKASKKQRGNHDAR